MTRPKKREPELYDEKFDVFGTNKSDGWILKEISENEWELLEKVCDNHQTGRQEIYKALVSIFKEKRNQVMSASEIFEALKIAVPEFSPTLEGSEDHKITRIVIYINAFNAHIGRNRKSNFTLKLLNPGTAKYPRPSREKQYQFHKIETW